MVSQADDPTNLAARNPPIPEALLPASRLWQTWLSWALIAVGALPRIWAAVMNQNIFTPDEIHQTMEQAHRFAFGYGMIPWEFRSGVRSWVFPGMIGLLWKLLALLGAKTAFGLVTGSKVVMVATTLIAVEVGRRMAVRMAGPTAGVVATLILLACPLEIFFSPKVTAENLSGLVLLLAVHLSVTAAPIRPGVAGALAAFAIFLRYQNGLVAMGLLIVISAHDRRAALRYAGVATLVGVAGGMLDWLTWDYPFQAFVKYVQFNLIENKGEAFGVASTTYFIEHLFATMGWGFGILLVGGVLGARRMLGPSLIILAYFVVHSMIPHKEVRFLLPILPLALVISSVGLTELAIRLTNPAVTIALAASVATALAIHAWSPTERAFGRSDSSLSVWHSGEDYILTMWQAEARPDLCGIALVGTQPWWTGGYTNMHRDVPMYVNADHLASANYVVGQRAEALPPEFERVFETGLYALFRRSGSCASDPAYRPWLN